MTASVASTVQKHLASEIRRRREAKRLSYAEAAEKARVSEVAWRKWESAERWPGPAKLADIARVLGCRISQLFP